MSPDQSAAPPTGVRDDLAYDRTHLATERTYAAWLRTGLSVAAGGIAVARLVPSPARGSAVSLLLGVAFVLLGIGIITYGAQQFAETTVRLCRERERPIPTSPRGAYGLTAFIAILLFAVLIFLWTHRGSVG
jgi:putative membrane protein